MLAQWTEGKVPDRGSDPACVEAWRQGLNAALGEREGLLARVRGLMEENTSLQAKNDLLGREWDAQKDEVCSLTRRLGEARDAKDALYQRAEALDNERKAAVVWAEVATQDRDRLGSEFHNFRGAVLAILDGRREDPAFGYAPGSPVAKVLENVRALRKEHDELRACYNNQRDTIKHYQTAFVYVHQAVSGYPFNVASEDEVSELKSWFHEAWEAIRDVRNLRTSANERLDMLRQIERAARTEATQMEVVLSNGDGVVELAQALRKQYDAAEAKATVNECCDAEVIRAQGREAEKWADAIHRLLQYLEGATAELPVIPSTLQHRAEVLCATIRALRIRKNDTDLREEQIIVKNLADLCKEANGQQSGWVAGSAWERVALAVRALAVRNKDNLGLAIERMDALLEIANIAGTGRENAPVAGPEEVVERVRKLREERDQYRRHSLQHMDEVLGLRKEVRGQAVTWTKDQVAGDVAGEIRDFRSAHEAAREMNRGLLAVVGYITEVAKTGQIAGDTHPAVAAMTANETAREAMRAVEQMARTVQHTRGVADEVATIAGHLDDILHGKECRRGAALSGNLWVSLEAVRALVEQSKGGVPSSDRVWGNVFRALEALEKRATTVTDCRVQYPEFPRGGALADRLGSTARAVAKLRNDYDIMRHHVAQAAAVDGDDEE
jgi:hypothetical protein